MIKALIKCFMHDKAPALVRSTGDILAPSPPLIISEDQIGQIAETIGAALQSIDEGSAGLRPRLPCPAAISAG